MVNDTFPNYSIFVIFGRRVTVFETFIKKSAAVETDDK